MATKHYKRDLSEMEQRRRKGIRMLAKGVSQADVARELEVSRQTASSWARKLADDPEAWRRQPLGRPSGLGEAQKRALAKALSAGTKANGFPGDRWTLVLVAQLVERKFGLSYSTVGIWRVLREMGNPWRLWTGRGPLRRGSGVSV
ncbi:winged helix-turn-helix domain-containing protein [Cupriavidus sp. 8B]